MLRDRFVCGLRDEDMKREVLKKCYGQIVSLEEARQICLTIEHSHGVAHQLTKQANGSMAAVSKLHSRYQSKGRNFASCRQCGGRMHQQRQMCPSQNVVCFQCEKTGHYAACCPQNKKVQLMLNHDDEKFRPTLDYIGALELNSVGDTTNLISLSVTISKKNMKWKFLPDTVSVSV